MTTPLTPQQRLDRAVTEAELLSFVLQAARLFGWLSFHARPAWSAKGFRTPVQGDGKGFVDVVLAHPQRGVIFAELKRERGVLSPEQERWIAALRTSGQRVEVWRPSNRDAITAALSGRPAVALDSGQAA